LPVSGHIRELTMSIGGQKPKPALLKDLHGSTQPRNDEPIPDGNLSDNPAGECPTHFTAEQRETWEYLLLHSPPSLLKKLDVGLLEAYVVALCLHRRAVREMADRALLHEQGPQLIPAPLLSIINKQADLVRKLGNELGFSPVSRPRIFANGPATAAIGASLNSAAHARPKDAPRKSLENYLADAPRATSVN
jgi:P27 family predicted phage terminase small subunit